ncbi:hypothetical protein EDB83DRAFT_2511911 [Lactarius deliciosus]|nr:hypothetical protein EDB83DRAFT_2511911 [Lactarius deliciosus]
MHLVNTGDLTEVGVSPGDAIWLKEFASSWWTDECRCVAKQSHEPETDKLNIDNYDAYIPVPPPIHNTTPLNKRLQFEKRYDDRGRMTAFGPNITNGGQDDHTWWVYSRDLKTYVPLPPGKVPMLADDNTFSL